MGGREFASCDAEGGEPWGRCCLLRPRSLRHSRPFRHHELWRLTDQKTDGSLARIFNLFSLVYCEEGLWGEKTGTKERLPSCLTMGLFICNIFASLTVGGLFNMSRSS